MSTRLARHASVVVMMVRFWKKALKWAFEVLQPHQKRANFPILKPAAAKHWNMEGVWSTKSKTKEEQFHKSSLRSEWLCLELIFWGWSPTKEFSTSVFHASLILCSQELLLILRHLDAKNRPSSATVKLAKFFYIWNVSIGPRNILQNLSNCASNFVLRFFEIIKK